MTDRGLQGSHTAIVDPKTGRSTNAFWRLLEMLWRRVGGFDDTLSDLAATDSNLAALIAGLDDGLGSALSAIGSANARRAPIEPALDFDARLAALAAVCDELRRGVIPPGESEIADLSERIEAVSRRLAALDIAGMAETGGGGGGAVTSVFARSGAVSAAAGDYDADQVDYDNSGSGLTATDVQGAIDEIVSASGAISSVFGRTGAIVAAAGDYDADQVDYDNSGSGLSATDVQDAIDELAAAGGIIPYYGVPFFRANGGTAFGAGNWGGRCVIAPFDCEIINVVGFVQAANGASVIRPAVYTITATGTVGNLVEQGPQVTGAAYGPLALPLDNPIPVSKGDVYWIGWQVLTSNLTMATVAGLDTCFFAAAGALPATAPAANYGAASSMCLWPEVQ